MTTYRKLEIEFNRKVERLRNSCPHLRLTAWMGVYWALGHSTGAQVRNCKRCDAEVSRRYCIRVCKHCNDEFSHYMVSCVKCEKTDTSLFEVEEHRGKRTKMKKIKDYIDNKMKKIR